MIPGLRSIEMGEGMGLRTMVGRLGFLAGGGSGKGGASRTTFLVGRVTPGVGEIIVVDGFASPPFPGPWTLRALVRSSRPPAPTPRPPAGTVH